MSSKLCCVLETTGGETSRCKQTPDAVWIAHLFSQPMPSRNRTQPISTWQIAISVCFGLCFIGILYTGLWRADQALAENIAAVKADLDQPAPAGFEKRLGIRSNLCKEFISFKYNPSDECDSGTCTAKRLCVRLALGGGNVIFQVVQVPLQMVIYFIRRFFGTTHTFYVIVKPAYEPLLEAA